MELQRIGLGTYKLKAEDCYFSVLRALALGYRQIDTATLYKNHKYVGNAIKDSKIPRHEIFITSKVHYTYIESGTVDAAIEKILSELQLDYVDMLLLHKPYSETNVKNWRCMMSIRASGKAKNIGVSNFGIADIEQIISETGVLPFLNQIEFNPLCQRTAIVKYCNEKGIKVQAYRSFALGKCLENEMIKRVANLMRITPAQVVLLWTIRKGVYIIPMSNCEKQMLENFGVKSLDLDFSALDALDGLNENYFTMPKNASAEDTK